MIQPIATITDVSAGAATKIWQQANDTCHLNDTARMGDAPAISVVDVDGRACDISNLWIR